MPVTAATRSLSSEESEDTRADYPTGSGGSDPVLGSSCWVAAKGLHHRIGVDPSVGCQPGGADNPGTVPQLGGNHLSLELELGDELVGVLAHSAAHHNQVRPKQGLKSLVVALQALCPLGVGQALLVLDARRGPRLGILAVNLEMTEFGVGHQHAAIDDRGADAGAQRGQDDQTRVALGRSELHLSNARSIGIVDQQDVPPEYILEDLLGFAVD